MIGTITSKPASSHLRIDFIILGSFRSRRKEQLLRSSLKQAQEPAWPMLVLALALARELGWPPALQHWQQMPALTQRRQAWLRHC
jgi:hypothetical protein